ncbi:MAG: hypothetical protein OSA45_16720 [Halioglobus sp.]|nr:hypothetical protein [Halioglobus sp.]
MENEYEEEIENTLFAQWEMGDLTSWFLAMKSTGSKASWGCAVEVGRLAGRAQRRRCRRISLALPESGFAEGE